MRTTIVPVENGRYIVIGQGEPVNYVSPIAYLEKLSKEVHLQARRMMLPQKLQHSPISEVILQKEADDDWQKKLIEIRALNLPDNYYKLLGSNKKKEQIKLLKGQSLTGDQWQSLLFRAGEAFGYTYSKFRVEFLPEWANGYKIPKLIHLRDDGTVETVGETNMSEGQLRQLMEQRTVRVSHFLDNGNRWHCLFTTYRSLNGQENYGKGTPHMHYLSNFWELDRKLVVNGLKSRSHKFTTSVHIPFIRHG